MSGNPSSGFNKPKFAVIFNSSLRKLTQHFMTKNHLAQTAVYTINAEKHCPEGFFFLFFFSLFKNIVGLVSGVCQSDSVIYVCVCVFQILFH